MAKQTNTLHIANGAPRGSAAGPHRKRSPHPCTQILLATVRRPWLWFWPVALSSALALVNIPLGAWQNGSGTELWVAISLAICSALFTATIVHHFAQLAAPPRGPTVPRLAARATAVGIVANALALIALAAIWPLHHMTATVEPNGDLSFYRLDTQTLPRLPFFTFAALASAILALSSRFRRLSLLAILLLATLSLQEVNDHLHLMLYGLHPRLMFALLTAAAILFTIVWSDIATRREEPAFNLRRPNFLARRTHTHAGLGAESDDPDSPRPARRPTTIPALRPAPSPWRRLAARRRATNAGVPASLAGALTGGILALWLCGLERAGFGLLSDLSIPIANVIVTALAGTMIASRLFAAQPTLLHYELLLPASRPSFVKLTGLAYAVDFLVVWAASQAAAFVVFALVDRALAARALPRFWVHLPVALAYLLVIFGALLWLSRARHRYFALIASNILCVASPFVLFPVLYANRLITREIALYAALPLALVGVSLTWTAYHRWTTGPLPLHPSKSALAL